MILYFVGMVLLKLLVFAAVVLSIYKLVVYIHGRYAKHMRWNKNEAIEILKKRYAMGEIEEQEYRTKLQVLRS